MYHFVLDVTWPRFFLLVSLGYVAVNALFALFYMSLGPGAFPGLIGEGVGTGFPAFFFFSVHTIATIGYGNVVPTGVLANVLVTLEALVGLLTFGLAAGLIFARFARPHAHILFSERAIIAPYHGQTAFEFRIVNGRQNEIVDLRARIVLTMRVPGDPRSYHTLSLERAQVYFFPLAWTVVHPIDEASPLYGLSDADLRAADAEFLILLSGFDETFSQTVHARSSYRADEVLWGRSFAGMFEDGGPGEALAIDVGRLGALRDE
jgi:inward rectifier potassium channel